MTEEEKKKYADFFEKHKYTEKVKRCCQCEKLFHETINIKVKFNLISRFYCKECFVRHGDILMNKRVYTICKWKTHSEVE